MTRLFANLLNRLTEIGVLGVEHADENLRDNEKYIRKVIKNKGPEKFKYASDYLKSDAEFILSVVEDCPEILKFCNDEIFDRYVKDTYEVEEDLMNMLIFLDLCFQKNDRCLSYFPKDIVEKYLNMLENGEVISGVYQGKEYEHKLELSEDDYLWLLVYQGKF